MRANCFNRCHRDGSLSLTFVVLCVSQITGWVVLSNTAFTSVAWPSAGELAFAVAMTVDVAAFMSMMFLVHEAILARHEQEVEHKAPLDELCIVADSRPVCGLPSFDSTEDYACVLEQLVDGRERWVCA